MVSTALEERFGEPGMNFYRCNCCDCAGVLYLEMRREYGCIQMIALRNQLIQFSEFAEDADCLIKVNPSHWIIRRYKEIIERVIEN